MGNPLDEFAARLGVSRADLPAAPNVSAPVDAMRARLAAAGIAGPVPSPAEVRADVMQNNPATADYVTRATSIAARELSMVPGLGPVALAAPVAADALRSSLTPKPRDIVEFTREQPPEPAIALGGPARPNATTVPATQSPMYPSLAPKVAVRPGGVGYGDPFAAMRGKLDADQARVLGTYDTEKDQTIGLGGLVQEREAAVGQARQVLAAKQVRDAELAQQEADDARARFDDYTAKTDALNAQLAERKVEPGRLMANMDMGSKAGMLIGGIAAGILSALNGGRNGVVDQVTKMIDDDVRQQELDIARTRDSVRERNTLLGQYMQIHGNAELAKLQARSAIYSATKDAILGRAEELGSREAMQNAMLAAGQVDRKQAELQQAIDANKLMVAQQQAAAAAAAARAAEEKIWSRQMELAKLGLEKDKLSIEAAKISREGDDKTNAEVQHLADKLAAPELAADRELVDSLYRRTLGPDGKVDPTKGLPGVGPTADLRERMAAPLSQHSAAQLALRGPVAALAASKAVGLDDSERVSRQDWENAKLAYRHLRTGAGGNVKELEGIEKAFQGAQTPAEQVNAIRQLKAAFDQQEARQMAGASPRAQAIFKARVEGISPTMPTTVKTK